MREALSKNKNYNSIFNSKKNTKNKKRNSPTMVEIQFKNL